jgi:UDP-N-acetylmuramoyl-L-alanyl-D-glutamate--2,6-diaminopimelate ligase
MSTPGFNLAALLRGVDGARIRWAGEGALEPDAVFVAEVRDDSRLVGPGDLFVAVPGAVADGRRFIPVAMARGARAVVLEGDTPPELRSFAGPVVTVPAARRALGVIAANRYAAAEAMTLLAVTGTNGKTTTTYIVESMLRAAGRAPGVFGTVAYRADGLPGGGRAAPLTTPGALMLHGLLADMRAVGTTDVVLEATSHALEQGRLDGCRFRVAALTNLTQDHLDYHGDMQQYFDAKAILFERLIEPGRGVAVTFVDDEAGRQMRARARGAGGHLGVARGPGRAASGADIVVEALTLGADGTRATLATPIGRLEIASGLVGEYNLANLALAVGMAVAHGLPADAIVDGVARLGGVPGRLERVENRRGVLCVVDYAHTPDALERAIAAVRPLVGRGGRLIVVFGCGGDRDRGKRPIMGEIAARDADIAVVTSDNPRTEDPASIVAMVREGVRRTGVPELPAAALSSAARGSHVEVDRRAAIQLAARAAAAGDVLLIAGKGHEDYQIVGTTRSHFDDREEAAAALAIN